MLHRRTLFIHPIYSSLCLLLPNAWSFPSPPSAALATVRGQLFSMSASLFLFHRYFHLCCLSDSTCKVLVFLFMTLLSMVISRSICVAAKASFPCLGLVLFHLCVCVRLCVCVCLHKCTRANYIFFTHSSVSGHYIEVPVSFWIIVFSQE